MNRMLNAMKFILNRSIDNDILKNGICSVVQDLDGCDRLGCSNCPFNSIENMFEMVEVYKELG